MQSKVLRPSRVVAQQTDSSSSSTSSSLVATNQIDTVAVRDVSRLANVIPVERKGAEVLSGSPEESSLTPPSLTGVTIVEDERISLLGLQKREAKFLPGQSHPILAIDSSQAASARVLASDGLNKDNSTFQKGSGYQEIQVATSAQNPQQQSIRNLEVAGANIKFEGTNMLENRKEAGNNRQFVEPKTRCSIAGSACPTTLSVYTGPTFQGTHAPGAGQTAFSTQMSLSNLEVPPNVHSHGIQDERGDPMKQVHEDNLHYGKNIQDKVVSSATNCLPSQVPLKNDPSLGSSKSSKVEKAPARKKHDSDIFFKVNGKKYQKLGKIGSGGSSEVYKVISADCTIYALKKIKLKGRDYPTACGFCQEIEYLKKLKGKNNIIQLVDYEVTDKSLLQEVINGSLTMKDRRIKDDECIYMVLEYGEIDLAHMLSHKWKETSSSGCKIEENWLRFYWQQMLEAVNTIHEERIVHSDLKPANFLLVRGALKLIDFGIAKAIMSDTTNIQRDAQVGTLNYMSPEAFMCNEPDVNGNTIKCGRPSDIWSLGCILYQMVYGKTPFAEYKTFWAKFKVVTDRTHEILYEPLMNPWLIDLMRRCLAWDRNERWRIPQLLQHPFLVPQVPRELPTLYDQHHPGKLLMERVSAHWTNPEVSKLCLDLQQVLAKLERVQNDPTAFLEPK